MLNKFRLRRRSQKEPKDVEKEKSERRSETSVDLKEIEHIMPAEASKEATSPILNPFDSAIEDPIDDLDIDDISGSEADESDNAESEAPRRKRRFGKPKFIKKIQSKFQAKRFKKKAKRENQTRPVFATNMHRVMEERRREQMKDLNAEEETSDAPQKEDTDVPMDTFADDDIRRNFPIIGKVRVTLMSVENICKHKRHRNMRVCVRLPPTTTENYLIERDTIGKTYDLDLYDISSELRIFMHDVPRVMPKELSPQLGQVVLPLSIFLREVSMFTPIHVKETLDVRLLPLKERYLSGPRYDGMFTPVYPDMASTGVATSHRNLGMLRLSIEITTEAPLASLYMMKSIIPDRPRYKFDVGLMKSGIARMSFITQTPALLLYISTLPLNARLGMFPILLSILYYIFFIEGGKCLLPFVLFSGICANGFLSFYIESIRQSELVIWASENEAIEEQTPIQKLKSLPGALVSLLNLLLRVESILERIPLAFNFSDRFISILCYGLLFCFTSFTSLLMWLIPAHVFGFIGGTILAFYALGLQELRTFLPISSATNVNAAGGNISQDHLILRPWHIFRRLKDRRVVDHEVCCERMVLNFEHNN